MNDFLRTIPFGKGIHFHDTEYITHTDLVLHRSALRTFDSRQKLWAVVGLLFLGWALWIDWHTTLILLVAALTLLYLLDLLFSLFLVNRSFKRQPEITISPAEIAALDGADLPVYTILCPLYKEWRVIPQFIAAIQRLDWPQHKLDVELLLEEDDQETIQEISKLTLHSSFRVIIVPPSLPRTKPKACNYGLLQARGEYVVIYDAEDIPEPDQLKKAYLALQHTNDSSVICAQAKLNFYNSHQNVLTRLFTTEYSLWFDLILTGLQSAQCPIPLGGTSNHFRVRDLRLLQGWDAFNVAEDCDLGMRIAQKDYATVIFNSTTFEEANSSLFNWLRQRSRWIKGYMQTYFVHSRYPMVHPTYLRGRYWITFHLIVGGKILSLFINPFLWLLTLGYFLFRDQLGLAIESFYPAPILYMGVFSLVFGNFLYLYYYVLGCMRRDQFDLVKYAVLIPGYWLLMSLAAWRALYQLVVKPHYWEKTVHGLHLDLQPQPQSHAYETSLEQ